MRDAVQDMVRKHKSLTQKQQIAADESDDDVSKEPGNDVTMTDHVTGNMNESNAKNPWMSANIRLKKSGAKDKQTDAVDKNVSLDVGEETDELPAAKKAKLAKNAKSTKKAGQKTNDTEKAEESEDDASKSDDVDENSADDESSSAEESDDNEVNDLDIDTIFDKAEQKAKKNKNSSNKVSDVASDLSSPKLDKASKEKKKTKRGKKEQEKENKESGDQSDIEADEGLALTTTRRQNLEDFEGDLLILEKENFIESVCLYRSFII